ncbi:MAG: tRNA (adenosine(37)-N6)-threonylcarbamoyltransferase complex ATPase subunit type 1 TsaE [Candidatus Moranbacteria bacterium]|nr:tRNA (adenosine(37)-N6)-threonylcarbamoyltransferase complex ATPase subunit type 1 TsaE [Candidatus Moranbacteria bacterium]
MQTEFITEKTQETKKLGKLLASELFGGEVVCLFGELGAGKTTFTQGLLEGLGAEKPYTSPTFVVMKEYKTVNSEQRTVNLPTPRLRQASSKEKLKSGKISTIYHFDAYRVEAEDILNLGWEEIIADESNICIIEWADKLEKIIPGWAIWIGFEWLDENRRKIILRQK